MFLTDSHLCFPQARLVPLLLHARSARERQREAQSEVCRIFSARSATRAPASRLNLLFPSSRSLHHGKSSSTGNLLENDGSLPTPDYGLTARLLAQSLAQTRPRPYSMAGFGTQVRQCV